MSGKEVVDTRQFCQDTVHETIFSWCCERRFAFEYGFDHGRSDRRGVIRFGVRSNFCKPVKLVSIYIRATDYLWEKNMSASAFVNSGDISSLCNVPFVAFLENLKKSFL